MYERTTITAPPQDVWKAITSTELWDEFMAWAREKKKKGEISASQYRQLQRIRAYWEGRAVQKRSGKGTVWADVIASEFLTERMQEKYILDGVISTSFDPEYQSRKAFVSLDEIREYLRSSGLIYEQGEKDARGREIWRLSEYVHIVWNPNDGLFYVCILS